MKIGELSKRTNVSIRMLRYYEQEGLLKPSRTQGGFRDYDLTDERTVERIKLLGSAGMTLTMIQRFLPCVRGEGAVLEPCDELRSALAEEVSKIDRKTERLLQSREVLESFMREIA